MAAGQTKLSSLGGSVSHIVELPVFSGPLDLLLQLIERDELDISSVSLALVTDQYLSHMRRAQDQELHNLSDFMVVAARLILIKSQSLLPRPLDLTPEEVDPGDDLARQLLLYRKFKEMASLLNDRQVDGLRTYVRLVSLPRPVPELDLAGKSISDLWRAAVSAFELSSNDESLVSSILSRPQVTVRDKINAIVVALRSGRVVHFFEFLRKGQARIEVVMTFLAILELVKMGMVLARQEGRFGDIEIARQGDWAQKQDLDIDADLDG